MCFSYFLVFFVACFFSHCHPELLILSSKPSDESIVNTLCLSTPASWLAAASDRKLFKEWVCQLRWRHNSGTHVAASTSQKYNIYMFIFIWMYGPSTHPWGAPRRGLWLNAQCLISSRRSHSSWYQSIHPHTNPSTWAVASWGSVSALLPWNFAGYLGCSLSTRHPC